MVIAQRRSRVDDAVPWLGGLALAAPVLLTRYPPMSDLSLLEGVAALVRHSGDPSFAPAGLYQLHLGHAQQLVPLAIALLSFAVPSDVASEMVVAAIVVATIVLGARACRYAGGSPWAALLLAPVVLGWRFYWGFAANMLGLALLLAAIPALDRYAEAPTRRGTVVASALIVVLFGAHTTSAASAVLVLAVFAAARRRARPLIGPAITLALLLALESWSDAASATPLAQALARQVTWHSLTTKIIDLPVGLFANHPPFARALMAGFPCLAIGLFLAARFTIRSRFALAALALLLVYLAAPYSMNYGAFLYVRFLAPAYALAIVALAPPASVVKLPAKAACAAAVVTTLSFAAEQFARASAEQRALDALYPRIERGSAVMTLSFGKRDPTRLFDITSSANRVLANRGGRLLYSFVEFPTSPVVVAPEKRWDATLRRIFEDSGALRPAFDLRRLRYVLIHVRDNALARLIVRGFEPEAAVVGTSGNWILFESKITSVPVDAPEEPLPQPPPETLQERVHRLAVTNP